MTQTFLATTTTGTKVHMSFGGTRPMCGPKAGSVDKVLLDMADLGAIGALLAANVAPSRVCGHCFYAQTRHAHKAAHTARPAAA